MIENNDTYNRKVKAQVMIDNNGTDRYESYRHCSFG